MARLIELPEFSDHRGSLCVIENILPFEIKRVYFIYGVKGERGGHRHKKTVQALICLSGACEVFVDNGREVKTYRLDRNVSCLIVDPADWHTMHSFSESSTLLVLASETYDATDYIVEPYG